MNNQIGKVDPTTMTIMKRFDPGGFNRAKLKLAKPPKISTRDTVATTKKTLFLTVVENFPWTQAFVKFSKWITLGGPSGLSAISGRLLRELNTKISKGTNAKIKYSVSTK